MLGPWIITRHHHSSRFDSAETRLTEASVDYNYAHTTYLETMCALSYVGQIWVVAREWHSRVIFLSPKSRVCPAVTFPPVCQDIEAIKNHLISISKKEMNKWKIKWHKLMTLSWPRTSQRTPLECFGLTLNCSKMIQDSISHTVSLSVSAKYETHLHFNCK